MKSRGGGWIQDPGGCSQWQPTCSRGVSWNDFLILKKISQFFPPCFQPSFHGIPPANSRAKWAESWPAQCCAVPWFGSQKLWFEVEISDVSCFQSLFVSNVHGVKIYFFTSKLPNAWGKLAQTNFPLKLQTSGQRLAMLVGYHRNGRVNIKGNCCHLWRCRTSHWFSGTLQVEVHWDWKCGSAVNFCDFIEIGQCMHPAFSCPVDMIWKSIAVSCLARSWLQRVMEAFGQSASWRRAPWEVQSDEMLSKPSRLSKLVNFCLFVLSMFAPSWNRYDRYSYTCFVWITEGFQTCQVVKPHWNLRSKKLEVAGPRVAEVVEELHFDATQRQRCVRCEAGNDLWNVIVECAFDVGIDRKSCASNVQQCTWGDASFGRLVGSLRFAGSSTGRHQNTSASQPLTLRLRWYKIQDSVIEKENCFQAQKCPIWPDAGSLPGSRIFFARIALLDSLDRMFLTRPINFSGVIQFVTCWGPPVLSLEVRLNCIRRKNTSVYGSVAPRLRHVRQVHLFKLQLGSQLSQLSQCLLWWTLWVWIHILWLWCVFCSRSLWRVRKIHQAYKTSFWVASAGFFGVHLCKSIPSVRQNLLSLEMSAG